MTKDQEFAARLAEMRVAATPTDTEDQDQVRLGELRAMFATFLPDATDAELFEVASYQQELQLQQDRLATLFEEGIVDHVEYSRAVNNEVSWALRRSARVLGEDRCKELFGVSELGTIALLDEEEFAREHGEYRVESLVPPIIELMERYMPVAAERRHVIQGIKELDPQQWRKISQVAWAPSSGYDELVRAIETAEEAYYVGDIQRSLQQARRVIEPIKSFTRVTDTPLYLTAWAHHIQGRAYESLTDWRSAFLHYEASLNLKIHMSEWLPTLPTLATEIKLGCVEMIQSPAEAATRLSRVSEVLKAESRLARQNLRMYRNLLEDSQVGLAEAYLIVGDEKLATQQAEEALTLARELHDAVGEIRVLFVLYRASAESASNIWSRIETLLEHEQQVATHPRVVLILAELERLTGKK